MIRPIVRREDNGGHGLTRSHGGTEKSRRTHETRRWAGPDGPAARSGATPRTQATDDVRACDLGVALDLFRAQRGHRRAAVRRLTRVVTRGGVAGATIWRPMRTAESPCASVSPWLRVQLLSVLDHVVLLAADVQDHRADGRRSPAASALSAPLRSLRGIVSAVSACLAACAPDERRGA